MRRLLVADKNVYHLREYAIVENEDGTYEYVAWDSKGEKLSWIRGDAHILGDVLALSRITSEGEEETFKTMKEVRKELKRLPDWWGKAKYYCIVFDRFAAMVKSCATGELLEEEGQEFKMVQSMLRNEGVVLSPKEKPRDSSGIRFT